MTSVLFGAAGPAVCGAAAGAGVYLLARSLRPAPAPNPARGRNLAGGRWAGTVNGAVTRIAGAPRARRLLLTEDLAVLGLDPTTHTATRMVRLLAAVAATVGLAMAATLTGVRLPALVLPIGCLAAMLLGLVSADRPLQRRVQARRQEARLAVAAYLDLVRILLVGGLPLYAALQTAADAGQGWAFTEILDALEWARSRHLPPDSGLDRLARRVPVAEFAELRLTISSALRGASPVLALQSKGTHMRAAEAAQARLEASVADAAMELPAAVVALAFVAFLTVPLLVILTGVGVTP